MIDRRGMIFAATAALAAASTSTKVQAVGPALEELPKLAPDLGAYQEHLQKLYGLIAKSSKEAPALVTGLVAPQVDGPQVEANLGGVQDQIPTTPLSPEDDAVQKELAKIYARLPPVLAPIDFQANILLANRVNAYLLYNPLGVESLLVHAKSLSETCIGLRRQAQELELLSLASRSEIALEDALLSYIKRAVDYANQDDGHIAGKMYSPKIADQARLVEDVGGVEYRKKIHEHELLYIKARFEELQFKNNKLQYDPGSNNYKNRFNFLKAEFNSNFIDLYNVASAARYGLQYVYGIKTSIPTLMEFDYLSTLVGWVSEAISALDRVLRGRGSTTLLIPLFNLDQAQGDRGLIKIVKDDLAKALAAPNPTFSFKLDRNVVPFNNSRLLGLNLFIWGKPIIIGQISYIGATFEQPETVLKADQGEPVYTAKRKFVLPVVANSSSDNISTKSGPEVFNLDPIGDWKVSLDLVAGKTALGEDINLLMSNFILALTVSYDA